ncbi:probable FBD-associated F-box protein At1g32375 [Capsella rubella]|uniref:probable FBD-associated F-box protein At1g32375 n=1 Tax=Capsella rubella TaxID=81985 RepID=UPI000CD5000C|nr:probable FBD-associated F-box protein At1g32375 [Capsella rubella]
MLSRVWFWLLGESEILKGPDRLSELPDALLLEILSLLPMEYVVATMFLSKRWRFLWMMVPRLVYDDRYKNIEKFSMFLDRSLVLHKAPIIEKLHFKLGQTCRNEDLPVWIRAANKSSVREMVMELDAYSRPSPIIIPRSLYTECRMLVTLSLINVILVDSSSHVSFPCLKSLKLVYVKYPNPGDEFVKKLLSNCHVLEDLEIVLKGPNDNVTTFTIRVPSLKSILVIYTLKYIIDDHSFVIDAPSLEHLKILDHNGRLCVIENNMPKLENAAIEISCFLPGKILASITSVKLLKLCLSSSQDVYPTSCVFPSLVRLTICTCDQPWVDLLMCMLRVSPNLRDLELDMVHRSKHEFWNEASLVPECLLSSLENLVWKGFEGTKAGKEVAAFILRSGNCLKKATIYSKTTDLNKKLEMIKELSLSPRGSRTCQLLFD